MEEKFEEFYKKVDLETKLEIELYKEQLNEEKEIKKSKLLKLLIDFICCIMVTIVFLGVRDSYIGVNIMIVLIIEMPIFVIPLLLILLSNKNSMKAKINIKNKFIKIMLKYIADDAKYMHNYSIQATDYLKAYPEYGDVFNSNYLITYNNENVKISEVISIKHYNSDKIKPLFDGLYYICNIGRNVNETVYIKTKGIENDLDYQKKYSKLYLKEYENNFKIFVSEKSKIINTALLEKLQEFYNYINREFEIVIINDCLYFRLHKIFFVDEIIMKKNSINKKMVKNYFDAIYVTKDLFDYIIQSAENIY